MELNQATTTPTQNPPPNSGRFRRGRWALIAFAMVAVLAVFWFVGFRPMLESMLRKKMLAFMETRFASQVELQSLRLSLVPRIGVTGSKFVFRHHGRTDVPPFVSMRRFEADIGLFGLLRGHVHHVRLDGLEIHVPPREERPKKEQDKQSGPPKHDVVVDELIADGTLLDLIPREPGKPHHQFHLYKLRIQGASASQPMNFQAVLSNPKPPGLIHSTGKLGPWQLDEPGDTPVAGSFRFEQADLGTFRTIAGILSSTGSYKGVLERIEVDGHTDTPDFMVRASGHPVDLKTQYHAIVDGTNGDTLLQPVIADFLHSRVIARGAVTQTEGVHGRTVVLDVTSEHARMEDLLMLGVKTRPAPLSGGVDLHTKFRLPPGHAPVIEKLFLDGSISVESGQFGNPSVQEKVDTLSEKARGEAKDGDDGQAPDRVVSNLQARFTLKDGVLTLQRISFRVPGADVSLSGNSTLRSQTLDFRGTLHMQAKVSETTSGVKSFLLKLADPFFKKKNTAGSVVPIKVTGTLKKPSFGLNLGGSK